jgi:DNA-binding GntR family transcriptional regulator
MTTHLSNQEIYERIYAAISERRLAPGTKLSEERLAQAFHASRTRIHEVLMRLSQELVIELHTNRGAFVASPTPRDLRDVFAVRRALERAIAVELCEKFAGQSVALLHAHLEQEAIARATGARDTLARLTGEFHVRLAEITENRLFGDNLRRLVALTGLAIAQYDSSASHACPDHEHADIVAAIEAGDARRAERIMLDHLHHVEQGIQLPAAAADEMDFEKIFRLDAQAPAVEPNAASAPKKRAAAPRKRALAKA